MRLKIHFVKQGEDNVADGKCPTCNGRGEIYNPEYDRLFDKMGDNYPSPVLIERRLKDMGIPEMLPCPDCKKQRK